jgi:hypothetical protein
VGIRRGRVIVALVVVVGATVVAALAVPGWAPVLAGFVLGVVGAGAGAVLQTIVVEDRRRSATLRALMSEIEENLERIGPEERTRAPLAISRSAWDAARELELPDDVLEKLRTAYALGADLNSRVGMVDRSRSSHILADPNSQTGIQAKKSHDDLVDESHRTAALARKAFGAARDALKAIA